MQSYTIKEVSQMFQLPASTLRYYEDMGILTDIARTESGQRIYLQKQMCIRDRSSLDVLIASSSAVWRAAQVSDV